MFEYTIKIPMEILNCEHCPFRTERLFSEHLESRSTLSGTVSITRRESFCNLQMKRIDTIERVGDYRSKCPLPKGKEVS